MSGEDDEGDRTDQGVWVSSEVSPDGHFVLSVEFSSDVSMPLDTVQARAYAAEVMRASAIARHDAAVARQIIEKLGLPVKEAALTLHMLRAGRPPLDAAALGLLSMTPEVSVSGNPFLACSVRIPSQVRAGPYDKDGQRSWQWSVAEAHQHAGQVLVGSAIVDLDSAYRRWLVERCGIEPERALNVVGDLSSFFHDDAEGEPV